MLINPKMSMSPKQIPREYGYQLFHDVAGINSEQATIAMTALRQFGNLYLISLLSPVISIIFSLTYYNINNLQFFLNNYYLIVKSHLRQEMANCPIIIVISINITNHWRDVGHNLCHDGGHSKVFSDRVHPNYCSKKTGIIKYSQRQI